ncbi:MAG TPA: TetR/AcrR family transcriptional regulator [Cytophagales bacterium]|nr:TetR/AcrR family transcriptional regulator [Cytophagales bacterium]
MRVKDEKKVVAIKEKALEILVNKGFDGLSMQKLAKEAGVSPATIYIYFKDRDDLIIQVALEEIQKMLEATLKGFSPEMHFEEGLKLQWINRVNYFLKYPMQAHLSEQIKYSPYYNIVFQKMDKTFQKTMGEFVHNAIKRNELVKLPLEVYWSIAFAPLYQLVKFHTSGRGLNRLEKFVLDENMMDQTLKLVIKALKP